MPVTSCEARRKFTVNHALNAVTDLDDYVEAAAQYDQAAEAIRLSGFELGMIKGRLSIYGRLVALLEATLEDGEPLDPHLTLRGERADDFLAKFGLIARSIKSLEECADLYDPKDVSQKFGYRLTRGRRARSICGKWEPE